MSATRHASVDTVLGALTIVADAESVVGIYFPDHTHPPTPEAIGEVVNEGDDPLISRAARELREYLDGRRQRFDVPVSTDGDEFSESVWAYLRTVPFGETTTYGRIARELGNPGLAQRVGRAVGHNPVSILIPCHRVVGADGALTGYAGGLERKRALLDLEASEDSRLF